MKYKPTIGLEVHAELKTNTKMFCGSLNDSDEKHPNTNICPVCAGHPGTLPTINKKAIESILKAGIALNGEIPQFSKFDRKNYFYPDLPKGYQISQYDLPLIFGGVLNGVRLRRIHLEEDAGRLAHGANLADQRRLDADTRRTNAEQSASFVDFNRAGVPLMELVSEPDITSAEQAVEFAKELRLILRYLEVSDADMEKGQMRIEANVSIRPNDKQMTSNNNRILEFNSKQFDQNSILLDKDSSENSLGTKVEVKNINSFKAVYDAIEYEINRQTDILKNGQKVVQETRGWDENKKATVSQRSKEEAHDYRYFPEPDLPPLDLSKFDLRKIKIEIPELPKEKRLRFLKEYNLTPEQAEILIGERKLAQYFEEVVSEMAADAKEGLPEKIKIFFNYFTTDLRGLMGKNEVALEELKITPENFADLIGLIAKGEITSRTAKDLLVKMFETGIDPHQVLKSEGLSQISDEGKLREIAKKIIEANPAAAEDYKKGKLNVLQFLVGKAMAELRGSGNPTTLQKVFVELLTDGI